MWPAKGGGKGIGGGKGGRGGRGIGREGRGRRGQDRIYHRQSPLIILASLSKSEQMDLSDRPLHVNKGLMGLGIMVDW